MGNGTSRSRNFRRLAACFTRDSLAPTSSLPRADPAPQIDTPWKESPQRSRPTSTSSLFSLDYTSSNAAAPRGSARHHRLQDLANDLIEPEKRCTQRCRGLQSALQLSSHPTNLPWNKRSVSPPNLSRISFQFSIGVSGAYARNLVVHMAQPSLDSEHTPVSSMPARKSFAQV